MLLVICQLSCDVIGYEGSKCDWCFLIRFFVTAGRSLIDSQIVHCHLSTTVLFRTKLTQTIIFHLLMKWLLGSNLSQLYILLLFSQSEPRSGQLFWYVFFELLFVRQIISFYSWTENFVSLKDVLKTKKVNTRKSNESESIKTINRLWPYLFLTWFLPGVCDRSVTGDSCLEPPPEQQEIMWTNKTVQTKNSPPHLHQCKFSDIREIVTLLQYLEILCY